MTIKEQLKEWLCERGITSDEANMVLDLTWEKVKETEAKDIWNKDMGEIIPTHPETTQEELHSAIMSVLWTTMKSEVRKLLYFKVEQLAELIVKFK